MTARPMLIRMLTLDDVEAYVAHLVAHSAESGREGDAYSGPYSRDEPFPAEQVRQRTRLRWSKPLDAPGWRRAWGAFDADRIAGSANVAGADLPAGLHRVTLGISVLRSYRRQGIGRRLLNEVIGWCRRQPSIDWLDLGVFGDNLPAQALFRGAGFLETGRLRDRWRLDGQRVDEISMTLAVDG